MSTLVDERIVQMGFDNKNFESNVKTSMSTIDKLKNSLNFSGMSNSIGKNFNSIDTSVLASGLSNVSSGFSAMEVVAITAISNITNRIIDMGIQMVKSLSFDNIMVGWEKYAQKTTSVATLVSQGFEMDTINKELEKLQWYTDETSYEFTEMVNNIGKFTAAGNGLEESVDAMMGIANWAALSGQNSSVASRAMYQLSQAMGTGVIRLQDWKSIQNANMDTKEFREMALSTAVAMGQLTQSIDGTYTTLTGKSFNINQFTSELDEQWFTADVLMDTLGKYSSTVDDIYNALQNDDSINTSSQAMEKYGYQMDEFGLKAFKAAQEARTLRDALNATKEAVGSSWTNIFEKIFGSYDLAKVLWTDLANELYGVFVEGLNVKNQILDAWVNLNGRNDIFANTEEDTGAFWNLFYAIVELRDLVKGSWDAIFPWSTMTEEGEYIADVGQKLKNFTARLKELSEGLYLSEETSEKLSNILQGIFSIIKIGIKAIKGLIVAAKPLVEVASLLASILFNKLSQWGASIRDFASTTSIFADSGKKIADALTSIISLIVGMNPIVRAIKLLEIFKKALSENGGTVENYSTIISGFKSVVDLIKNIFESLGNTFVKDVLPAFGKLLGILAKFAGLLTGKMVKGLAYIAQYISKFTEWAITTGYFNKAFDKIIGFLKTIPERLSFLQPYLIIFLSFLNTLWNILKKIPSAVNGFVKSLTGNSLFEIFKKLGEGLSNILTSIKNTFADMGRVDTGGADKLNSDVESKFKPLALLLNGIANLFVGVWEVLKHIIPVIGIMLGYIGDILQYLGKQLGKVFSGDSGLFSIEKLLDVAFWTVILYSLYKMVDIFLSLQDAFSSIVGGFADVLDSKAMLQYAQALKELMIAMLIMVGALLILASMDAGQLTKSIGVLAVLMGLMVGLMKVMQVTSGLGSSIGGIGVKGLMLSYSMVKLAEAMTMLAGSVLIMAIAMKLISTIDKDSMVDALMGIIALVGVLIGASAIIGKNQQLFDKGAKGLIKMALAVTLLAGPVKKLGQLELKELIKGIAAVTALVGLTVIFSRFSSSINKSLLTSAALLSFAISLNLLMIPLIILSKMSTSSVLNALKSLTMVIIALSLLTSVIHAKDYAKMAGLGISLMILSPGLLALSAALLSFSMVNWKAVALGIGSIGALGLLTRLLGGTTSIMFVLLGAGLVVLSGGIIALATSMAVLSAVKLGNVIKSLLLFAASVTVFAIAAKLLMPVIPALMGLGAAVILFGTGLLLITTALTVFVAGGSMLVTTIVNVLIKLVDAIIELIPKVVTAVIKLISSVIQAITTLIPTLLNTISSVISAILDLLYNQGPKLFETVTYLITNALASLATHFPAIAESIVSILMSLLSAIANSATELATTILDIILKMLDTLVTAIPDLVIRLGEILRTFILESVKVFNTVLPDILTSLFDLVIGIIDGLGLAIENNAGRIREAMEGFAGHLWNAFINFFGSGTDNSKFVNAGLDLVKDLIKGISNSFVSIKTKVEELAKGIGTWFSNSVADFKTFGSDIIDGLLIGITQGFQNLKKKVEEVAKGIGGWFANILGIKSPSRVFMEYGGFINEGLAIGINDSTGMVKDSIVGMTDDINKQVDKTGLTNVLSKVSDLITGDMDNEIVIRPVLDLTEIQNGTNQMRSMMSDSEYAISGSNRYAERAYSSVKEASSVAASKKEVSNTVNETINNVFNITSNGNPKEIADEVSRILQEKIIRRKALNV